jgi:hypothetical protein
MKQRHTRPAPFFSICIPQYNRTDHLLVAIRTLSVQSYKDIEVCISDDVSPEGRHEEIIACLELSGLDYAYRINAHNLRYDGNLRSAMSLARGRYCFLHGNDDCLTSSETLAHLRRALEDAGYPAVAITNFEDYRTAAPHARVLVESLDAGGADVAAGNFRNFSFVTGVILDRAQCAALSTDRWDGSEMYQMYLGTCMIAAEGGLLRTPYSAARKDVLIPGQSVDSFLTSGTREGTDGLTPIERPIHSLVRLVVDAIQRGSRTQVRSGVAVRVCLQMYTFTLPFWLIQCRSHKGWRYAFRFNLASRPSSLARGVVLGVAGRAIAWAAYLASSLAGLCAPMRLSKRLFPVLYRFRNVIR